MASLWGGDEIFQRSGVSESSLLRIYDGVIHLVTAARGAPDFYRQGFTVDDRGSPVLRSESPEQACIIDQALVQTYQHHSRQFIVDNLDNNSFAAKIVEVIHAVFSIAYDALVAASAPSTVIQRPFPLLSPHSLLSRLKPFSVLSPQHFPRR